MGLRIGTVSPITGANGWKGRPLMVNQASDVVPRQSQKESRRSGDR